MIAAAEADTVAEGRIAEFSSISFSQLVWSHGLKSLSRNIWQKGTPIQPILLSDTVFQKSLL